MNCAREARKLADYLISLPIIFPTQQPAKQFSYSHVGALFTDVTLQSGLNYQTVVRPRVQQVLLKYPYEYTVTRFQRVICKEGLNNVINWTHRIKLERFERLMSFSLCHHIDSCRDLQVCLQETTNRSAFLSLNGFGPKSLDYLLKLLNVDNIAVDRHIYSFIKLADIEINGYYQTKKVVEYAADFLNIPRSVMDQVIWSYMSNRSTRSVKQSC